jgi:hypothetical protein
MSPEAEREANIEFSEAVIQCTPSKWASKDDRWLSHNGVHLPTQIAYDNKLEVTSPVRDGWFAIQVALKDGLRPDLSLARDEIRGFSWACYSRLALTLFRCLRANGLGSTINDGFIDDELKKKNAELGELVREIEVIADWENEPVISTSEGTVSLSKLREMAGTGKGVTLSAPVDVDDWLHGKPTFIGCLSAALVQLGVTVTAKEDTLKVDSPQPPEIKDSQLLFPPLFFVPYQESGLFRKSRMPINSNHPFSRWWLAHAAELKRKHPGLFESLRVNASRQAWDDPPIAESLNEILARLRQIEPALVPKRLELDAKEITRY